MLEATKLRYSEFNNIRILGRLFENAEKELKQNGKVSEKLLAAISFEMDKNRNDPKELAEFWEFIENSKVWQQINK